MPSVLDIVSVFERDTKGHSRLARVQQISDPQKFVIFTILIAPGMVLDLTVVSAFSVLNKIEKTADVNKITELPTLP